MSLLSTNRLSLLTIHLKKVKNGEFDTIGVEVGKDEIGSVMNNFNLMVTKIEDGLYQVQVVSWYDNENSYTSQMVRTIKYFAEL